MADIRHIKQISIRYYLAERSLYPTKDNPRYGLYLSPLREEHTPSFKVDYEQNLWYDFGLGEGGSIIDLVMCMELCDAGEAIQRLERHIDGMSVSTFLRKISGITSKNGRNDAKRLNIRVVTVSNDDKPKNRKTQRKADLRRRMVCKSLPVKE